MTEEEETELLIQMARNAALEEAARVAEGLAQATAPQVNDPKDQFGLPYAEAKRTADILTRVAAAIRALKSPQQTET